MKLKMQDKQNKLIERVSDKHLVIRIDIAQQFLIARAVSFCGIVIGEPFTFYDDDTGFSNLLHWVYKLKRENGEQVHFIYIS